MNMKTRAIIPLAVGLLVGILAIKIFADVLRKARGATSAGEMTSIVCAAADISATAEVTPTLLATQSVPKSLAPKTSFADPKEVAGRVAAMGIAKGMPIVESYLAPKGTPPGMVARIKEGYRAMAVKVDESSGVAGWLKPGCFVDVVALMASDASMKKMNISRLILENVEVLAVGQDIGAKGDAEASVTKSVTLAVLPEDVPKLHLAATKGTLRLAMRNSRDVSPSAAASTTDNDLLGTPAPQTSPGETPSAPKGSSFLSALFSKQPKMPADKTDKGSGATLTPSLGPTMAAPSSQAPVWRVEVLAGQEREELWFDGKGTYARRMDSEVGGSSKGSRARLGGSSSPPMTCMPAPTDSTEPERSHGPMEFRE